jgi:hypothetical protein
MGTRLLVALALVVSLAACKRTSTQYCIKNPTVPECAPDAAITTCAGDPDCPMSRPHCDVPSGTCVVQCTSDNDCHDPLPFCDIPRQVCVECTNSEQCASGACLVDGTCQSVNNTAYVDSTNGDDANPCSETMPCKTLEVGLMTTFPNIKLIGNFVDAKKVTIARDANIFADPPGVTFMVTMNGDAFTLAAGVHVTLSGLDITPMAGNCIKFTMPATLTLSQCKLHGGTPNGLLAMAGGSVTISRTIVYGNQKQGVVLMGATHFDITNSIFVHNGTAPADVGGAGISLGAGTGSADRFEFNTVADNSAKVTMATDSGGVGCPAGFNAPDNLLANNIGGTLSATANSIGCVVTGSRVATDDNDFVDPTNNDYHLKSTSGAIDGAPADPAITTDYDGESRPNGGYDYGADEHH